MTVRPIYNDYKRERYPWEDRTRTLRTEPVPAKSALYRMRTKAKLRAIWLAADVDNDDHGREVLTWTGDAFSSDPIAARFTITATIGEEYDRISCEDDCHTPIAPRDCWAPRGMAKGDAWLYRCQQSAQVDAWLADDTGGRHVSAWVSVTVQDPEGSETFHDVIGTELDTTRPEYGDATQDMLAVAEECFGTFDDIVADAIDAWRREERERAAYPDMMTMGAGR